MKNEIAITRRTTYKAEESVQALEKEKRRQDNLIELLQDTLKGLHQQASLYSAQVRSKARRGEVVNTSCSVPTGCACSLRLCALGVSHHR